MATNVVSVLNDLIETSKDGEKGFRKAAEDAHDAQPKTMFLSRAEDCMCGARELQDVVQGLGGKPETVGSMSGAWRASTTPVCRSTPSTRAQPSCSATTAAC